MKKLIKIFLGIIVSLILIIVLAAILIPIFVDPNDFKEQIAQQVQQQTGRKLTIEGDIDLSISLPLSVSLELGKLELSNAKGFEDKPFAKMQGASVFVAIMPLLTDNRLDIGEIKLAGMELNLIKNKQGKTNWDDLAQNQQKTTAADKDKKQSTDNKQKKASTELPAISVAGLSISDAQISWVDEQAQQSIRLSKSNISISELIEDKPFKLSIATEITSNNPAINGSFSLKTTPSISLSKQLFHLPDTELALDLSGEALQGGSNKTTLSGDISFNGNSQILTIKQLLLASHIDSKNPAIKGDIKLQSSPTIALAEQKVQLPGTTLTIDLQGKMLPGGANKTILSGDIKLDGKAQLVDISKMKLTSYDMVINGLFHASKISSSPEYSGQISIDKFSPKKLAATLGATLPEMKEQQALTSADAKLSFKGNQNAVTISSLEANLDDTSLKGSASVKNFKKPFYGFDLTLNQLNLDYYALAAPAETAGKAPVTAVSKEKTAQTKAKSTNPPLFPVKLLRQLNLSGKLAINEFIAGKAKMSKVLIILKGKDGLVQLTPLKANLYQGTIKLNSDLDARGKTAKLKIVNELKNVQIGDLLLDTTGSQELTGAANISANISSTGNNSQNLTKNANGIVKLLVTDGHIKKLDILSTIRQADALLKGKSAPSESQDKNTQFAELKATLNIKNGVIHNDDLASKSPLMELTGKGYIDLPKEYLDYTLAVKLLNSLKIDKNTEGSDFKQREIPYTIKGKFSEISENANISKVLEQEVKRKVEDKINKKLEEKFGDKFKGMLKF